MHNVCKYVCRRQRVKNKKLLVALRASSSHIGPSKSYFERKYSLFV